MSPSRRALCVALTAVAAFAAVLPATALGASVRVDAGRAIYDAALGEANALSLSEVGGDLRFSDGAGITPGTGCAAVNATTADCTLGPATVNLGDIDDSFAVAGALSNDIVVNGCDGDDLLAGSARNDQLNGDNGDDNLTGLAGDDKLNGGAGNDSGTGGSGVDEFLGGAGNDGPFSGGTEKDTLDGGPGRDTGFDGGAGDDILRGGDDADSGFDGGAGNDSIDMGNGNDIGVNGEDGDDTILLGPGEDAPQGFGPTLDDGIDSYSGGPGDDTFFPAPGGTGADTYDGNEGIDQVILFTYTVDVTINLDGVANDGAAGENDNILNFESAGGGPGNDTLVGNATTRGLSGDSGNDILVGGPASEELDGNSGDDTLNGGGGNDELFGSSGNDAINGGDGNDLLEGSTGADAINGGAGIDTGDWRDDDIGVTLTVNNVADDGALGEGDALGADVENLFTGTGSDTVVSPPGPSLIVTGNGDDVIAARDGAPDVINCGNGRDRVAVDAIDTIDVQGAERCEDVDRLVAALPTIFSVTTKVSRSGVLTLRITCPLQATVGCDGRASLAGNRGKGTFTTPAATVATLKIKLSRSSRATLRRRGRLRVRITVNFVDAAGRTGTLTRTVTLKR